MDLTPNFDEREFRSRGEPVWDRDKLKRLAWNLEVLREQFDAPMSVVSGCRTVEDIDGNEGSPRSTHMECAAVDVSVEGVDPAVVLATASKLIDEGRMDQGGLGLYEDWVHYDLRGRASRGFGDDEDSSIDLDDVEISSGLDIRRVYQEEPDDIDTPEEPASLPTSPPEEAPPATRKKSNPKRIVIAGTIMVGVAIAAAGIYWWVSSKKK